MKKIIVVILAIFALILFSCNIEQRRAKKCKKWGVCSTATSTTIIKDSIVHDTTLIPESTMWMDLTFACDSEKRVIIKSIDSLNSVNSNLLMKLKDGKFTVFVKVPERVVVSDTIYKERYVTKENIVSVPAKLSTLQKSLIAIGIVSLLLILIIIVIKIRKLFI